MRDERILLDNRGLTSLDLLSGWSVARHDIGIDGRVLEQRSLAMVGVSVQKMGAETSKSALLYRQALGERGLQQSETDYEKGCIRSCSLVVPGINTPEMASAQCLEKTVSGANREQSLMTIKRHLAQQTKTEGS